LSPDYSYSRLSVMNYCKSLTGLVIFQHRTSNLYLNGHFLFPAVWRIIDGSDDRRSDNRRYSVRCRLFFFLIFTGNLNQHVMSAISKKINMKFQTTNLPKKSITGKCEVFAALLIEFRVFFGPKPWILLYGYQGFG